MAASPEPQPAPPAAPRRAWSRWLLLAGLVAAVVLFYVLDLQRYVSWEYIQDHLEYWRGQAEQYLLSALLLFLLVYVAITALSLPVATFLSLAAGALFGLWLGSAVVVVSATLGATLAFLSSRYLLRDWVQRRFGQHLRVINEGIERSGAYYLFTLRLVPLFPFFLINLAMGLTPIRVWTFAWVSLVGMLPATLVYVNAGRAASLIKNPRDLLTWPVLGAFALLAVLPLLLRLLLSWLRPAAASPERKSHEPAAPAP